MAKVNAEINEMDEQERERVAARIKEERTENGSGGDGPFVETRGGGE